MSQADDAIDGHARMLTALQSIADDPHDAFFGDFRLKQLRAKRSALPANSARDLEAAEIIFALGNQELRLGNPEKAVEELANVYQMLPTLAGQLSPRQRRDVIFSLAIAYLRWGETQNCVAMHTSQSCIFPLEGTGVHKNQVSSKEAITYLKEILKDDPGNLTVRWILNIAYMTIGGYPSDVPREHRIDPSLFASQEEFPRFIDIAPQLQLNGFNLAGGAIADDFNGLLDIFTSTWDTSGQIHFFRNAGYGSYVEETRRRDSRAS